MHNEYAIDLTCHAPMDVMSERGPRLFQVQVIHAAVCRTDENIIIQEAGLDGFWIDRALRNEGIESRVVDPASINPVGAGGRRLMGSTARRWFARCWPRKPHT